MSENLNRGIRDFSQYDTMETEELEHILRLDAEAPEGAESDTELLLYVMEVLASRRNNTNITGNTAQQAWESFQKYYMPEECLDVESKKECKRIAAPWVRRIIATAAVVALIVFIPITAKAFGQEDIWNVIAHWAMETFSFVNGENSEISEPDINHKEEYTSLQELLADYNRDDSIVPSWIPDGYTLEKIEQDITPVRESYRATYKNNERILKIRIQTYLDNDPGIIEINEDLIEVYESNGIEFYIFSNHNQNRTVWITDSYECYIAGDISIDEMKKMIDTIPKG